MQRHLLLVLLLGFLGLGAMRAEAADRAETLAALCSGEAARTSAAAVALVEAAVAAPREAIAWSAQALKALADRKLVCAPGAVVIDLDGGRDALTLEPAPKPADGRTPLPNLRARAALENALAALTLVTGPEPAQRLKAAQDLAKRPGGVPLALIERALEEESDPGVRTLLGDLAVTLSLRAPDPAARIAAVQRIGSDPTTRNLRLLEELAAEPGYAEDPAVGEALDATIAQMRRTQAVAQGLTLAFNGLSYAAVLFMAALGLAIIFGLMGVINLAQGEMIMLGAYATWLVQKGFELAAPGLLPWYLLAAVPVAFLATAGIGLVIETTVVSRLYKRPLTTLLATWAVSLFLVNLVRVTFGTQNLQFFMPFYVEGGVRVLGDFIVTWNRLFAIAFAAASLVFTWLVLTRTDLGLFIRAVAQNRDMAGCVGIATRKVDRLAFALGSGLAGLAGLALAPIYSVNPNMGTNFIVDSFMVVVLGGVGKLLGTVVAALGIGQVGVAIEPFYGAVAAKVIVLLAIIAFLQVRPEGLFAPKGRRR